jgi:phage-related minor tail protein
MRRVLLAILGLLLAFPLAGAAQQESVAEAARKAREKKKDAPKATKTFTNDNLPSKGAVSVVGAQPAPAKEGEAGKEAKEGEASGEKDEGYWRARFAEARRKIREAEKEADLIQREMNLNQVQFYSDPNKALREQYERKEINEQKKKLDDKQAEIRDLKRQLSELEDELRRAGGNPAWGREP